MATLKEIQEEIENVFYAIEESTDENRKEFEGLLDSYLQELGNLEAEKADSIGFMVREQSARIEFLKAEEKRINARRKSAENALQRTKDYFRAVMQESGLQSVKGATSTIYLRKSESVQVNVSPEFLPEEYRKTTVSAKAADIKKALKAGVSIDGCELREGVSFNVR